MKEYITCPMPALQFNGRARDVVSNVQRTETKKDKNGQCDIPWGTQWTIQIHKRDTITTMVIWMIYGIRTELFQIRSFQKAETEHTVNSQRSDLQRKPI